MARPLRSMWPLIAGSLVLLPGCHPRSEFTGHECRDYYQGYATQIEYPDTEIPISVDALQPRHRTRCDGQPTWRPGR